MLETIDGVLYGQKLADSILMQIGLNIVMQLYGRTSYHELLDLWGNCD